MAKIADLPHVGRAVSLVNFTLLPLGLNGLPIPASAPVTYGSVNGEGFDQDQMTVAHGHMPPAESTNEFVMDSATARTWGFHLGQEVTFGAYTEQQSLSSAYFTNELRPRFLITAKLVGIGLSEAFNVVQDETDASNSSLVLFTHALTRKLLVCCTTGTTVGLRLVDGSRYLGAVESELAKVLLDYEFSGNGGDLPTQVEPLLDKDRLIAAWSPVYFGSLPIDGQNVPVMGATTGPAGRSALAVRPRSRRTQPGGARRRHLGPAT